MNTTPALTKENINVWKDKLLLLFDKFGYELFVFILLAVQVLDNSHRTEAMSPIRTTFYLGDLSMGFASRLIIGSFVNLLTDNPTPEWLASYGRVVLWAVLIAVSIVLGRILRKTAKEMKDAALIFTLFFCTGSLTLYGFSYFFGMLDIYMFIAMLASALLINNKYLRWLVPLLSVFGVFVNYAYLITYFPLVILLILYNTAKTKKPVDIIYFIASCLPIIAATVYCVLFERNSVTITFSELWDTMIEKSGYPFVYEEVCYFDFYLFGVSDSYGVANFEFNNMTPIEFLTSLPKIVFSLELDTTTYFILGSIALPVLAVFISLWIKCIKLSQTKTEKFVFLCAILATLLIFLNCIISNDITRWVEAGFIVQFGFVFFLFAKRDETFRRVIIRTKEWMKGKSLLLVLGFFVHATSLVGFASSY